MDKFFFLTSNKICWCLHCKCVNVSLCMCFQIFWLNFYWNIFYSFLPHSKDLNNKCLFFAFIYSRQDLQSLHLLLWSILARLSAILDSELEVNLKLSINFSFYVIVLSFSSSFFIGTEKVMHFSVFSPKHSNCPQIFLPTL